MDYLDKDKIKKFKFGGKKPKKKEEGSAYERLMKRAEEIRQERLEKEATEKERKTENENYSDGGIKEHDAKKAALIILIKGKSKKK